MDPMSGRIYKANTELTKEAMEQSVQRMLQGDDTALVPIPPELSAKLHAMTQEQRLEWAAKERKRLRAAANRKPLTRNQRKAQRRERRRKGR